MDWQELKKQLEEWAVQYAPSVAGALAFLIGGYIVACIAGRLMRRLAHKVKVDGTLSGFLGSVSKWTVMALVVVACLSIFNVETTSFAALIGAAGLAIGLAMQGSLGNLAAGVMLLIARPFKAGDAVRINGELGKVVEIDLLNTQIDTFDNRRIIVPNNSVFGNMIENLTYHPIRRVEVPVGVEYSADLDRTREVLTAAAARVPGSLDEPERQILLTELGGSSINWIVRVWCKTEDFFTVKDATVREVKMALDEAGLGIPFPQMDVHLDRLDKD